MYQVFSVDICCQGYAIDFLLIGAKNKDDLRTHIVPILESVNIDSNEIGNIVSAFGFDARVKEKDGLYTDRPYEVLDRFAYYE